MNKTLIILNPHAASGTTQQVWKKLRPVVEREFGELLIDVTESPTAVPDAIVEGYAAGARRVLSLGGDGTNHSVINALLHFQDAHPNADYMAFGCIPVGTGSDWARYLSIPLKSTAAVHWLAAATPRPTDIGVMTYRTVDGEQREVFLNICSLGIGGAVAARVNARERRFPWTFAVQSIRTILDYSPCHITMRLDDDDTPWFDDETFITVVANGGIFGHGMKIAPNAIVDDGLFDVLTLPAVSRWSLLRLLLRVYNGSHLNHPHIQLRRARQVEITVHDGGSLPIETDGETHRGGQMYFHIRPNAIMLLR